MPMQLEVTIKNRRRILFLCEHSVLISGIFIFFVYLSCQHFYLLLEPSSLSTLAACAVIALTASSLWCHCTDRLFLFKLLFAASGAAATLAASFSIFLDRRYVHGQETKPQF
jgi:hypothetical protein